jgi:hypothetical protein
VELNNIANTGKIIVIIGLIIIIIGLILWLGISKFSWFGHLPGDVRIEKKNFSFYFPITTMIIISVVLSLIFWIVGKILK